MRRNLKLIFAFLFLGSLEITPLWVIAAGLEEMGAGARAPGMANAFVGVADDVNAVVYNPAGLTQIREAQVAAEHSSYLGNLDDGSSFNSNYLAYVHPLTKNRGILGFTYYNFDQGNLITDRTLQLSYSHKLKLNPARFPGIWSAGFNLKQLHREFNPNSYTQNAINDVGTGTGQTDPLFAQNGYRKDAYSLDLGLLTQFGPANKHSAGLMITNLNRPDLSLAGTGDKAPLLIKLGAATRPHWGLLTAELRRGQRLSGQTDTDVAVGAERFFKLTNLGLLGIRGGYASGSREFQEMTFGLSLHIAQTSIDYAFGFPMGNLDGMGATQRIGLTFKFNALTPEESSSTRPIPMTKEPAVQTSSAPTLTTSTHSMTSQKLSEKTAFEKLVEEFTEDMGTYFTRKSQGAPADERLKKLLQIMQKYENQGLNLELVEKELTAVQLELTPTPQPTPKILAIPASVPSRATTPPPPVKPTIKTTGVVKPISKELPLGNNLDEAWRYYREVVRRGVSDRERIETLEAILKRFGDDNSRRVTTELERIRRRTQ